MTPIDDGEDRTLSLLFELDSLDMDAQPLESRCFIIMETRPQVVHHDRAKSQQGIVPSLSIVEGPMGHFRTRIFLFTRWPIRLSVTTAHTASLFLIS